MIDLPESLLSVGSALWLGILSSISPCPLATNVAAISFLGRRVDSPRHVFGGGMLYTAGRTAAYVALGILCVMGLLSIPETSRFLQRHINRILGPVLILTSLFLLRWLRLRLPGLGQVGERLRQGLEARGVWGAAPLGVLFALSFCPVSAALFFGSVIPLALRFESPLLYPSLYGVGTSLPVVVFAFLVAFGARFVGKALDRLAQIDRWSRWLTAAVFIVVGVYMTLAYTFGLEI